MATKLSWEYDDHSGEYHAFHNGHRIRAVRDEPPSNPFEDGDCNWPIIVRDPDSRGYRSGFITYEFGVKSQGKVGADLSFFDRAQLVHDQHAILKALGWTGSSELPTAAMVRAFETYLTEDPVGYCTDPDVLTDLLEQVFDDNSDSEKLEQLTQLYALAGIPAVCTTVTGHSQGDQAEVLAIATPEAQKKFGFDPSVAWDGERWLKELKSTAELYGHWAYGDVYGYIVEKIEPGAAECVRCGSTDNDGSDMCTDCGDEMEDPEPEYVELPDGSCWGFYGTEFDESGLEEAALDCVPDETVRDPDENANG